MSRTLANVANSIILSNYNSYKKKITLYKVRIEYK